MRKPVHMLTDTKQVYLIYRGDGIKTVCVYSSFGRARKVMCDECLSKVTELGGHDKVEYTVGKMTNIEFRVKETNKCFEWRIF